MTEKVSGVKISQPSKNLSQTNNLPHLTGGFHSSSETQAHTFLAPDRLQEPQLFVTTGTHLKTSDHTLISFPPTPEFPLALLAAQRGPNLGSCTAINALAGIISFLLVEIIALAPDAVCQSRGGGPRNAEASLRARPL
jgi:hypothetical protein